MNTGALKKPINMNIPDFIDLHPQNAQAQALPVTDEIIPHQTERFLIGSLLNTALDLGVFAVLTGATGALASLPVAAKAISCLAGSANHLVMNHAWPVKSSKSAYFLSSLIGLGINVWIMQLALLAALPQTAALWLATAAVLAWNWIASRILLKQDHLI